MSRLLITQYYRELDNIIQYGGSRQKTSIRVAFQALLNQYCKTRDFLLIPELDYKTSTGKRVKPDGTVKDALRLDWGYWESKDQYDNLDEEIEKKLAQGYPNDNILFEDSQTAVLIQGGKESLRVTMRDTDGLDQILNAFINYTRPEVRDFRDAIARFQSDLPTILNTLRDTINLQGRNNPNFITAMDKFWKICQQSINPEINLEDISEMMIQHILTEDIFINIFKESQFHRENNIARELHNVIETFFTGNTRRNTLSSIECYYAVIRRNAANIYNHHEKQKFLKAVYENFYQAYNPQSAERLGIVYTPNEIVRFMIESVDYLVHKHFGKLLADPDVEILDPATGTGTFITELIEYLPKDKLQYKYQNEIHCNEVAILPYYIANLNIEFTYKQKMGEYLEFANICFVDTLDNTSFEDKQYDLFSLTVENTERILRQNDRKISVVIGNPPYRANQANENDNNKNRKYPAIDKVIKDTYIKASNAQKTKLYDMYSRFFRWATNRLNKNGAIAFVTNSSFINGKTFDGFRKIVCDEFSEIYVIDLGGDIWSGDKTGNVFNVKVGIAISFMIKRDEIIKTPCKIFYAHIPTLDTAEEKLRFLESTKLAQISFQHITPDHNHNWLNLNETDFDSFIPLVDKATKLANPRENHAIFHLFSLGISTNRDEWVYDFNEIALTEKIKFFSEIYEEDRIRWHNSIMINNRTNDFVNRQIKWTTELESYLKKGSILSYSQDYFTVGLYRPYIKKRLYYARIIIHRFYQQDHIFPIGLKRDNLIITFTDPGSQKPFMSLASNEIPDLHLNGAACGTQCLPLYRYDKEGNRIDNITDWGLNQFQIYYRDATITKKDIFHYTYAVLHNPIYRQKYELNLKRQFPRIPFYQNFHQWVKWGKQLMELHLNYETVTPYPLTRVNLPEKTAPKPKLKADMDKGSMILDDITTLEGIPKMAWEYRLGNRSALEWILDQYKEKKLKDPTIAQNFNPYRFADYKDTVIELLTRVCTVSVETMKIIAQMEKINS
jgi:predicted helicase